MTALDSRASLRSSTSALARAALGAICVLAILVAAHYAFVALYSYVMEPGHELAHYQEFALQTGPPFATVLGFFVTYLVASWVASGAANPWPRSLLLVAVCEALEVAMYVAMGFASEILAATHLLAASSKLAGAALAAVILQARRARSETVAGTSSRS